MIASKLTLSIAAAASISVLLGVAPAKAAAESDLRVYFKLDDRLTQPLHMGERLASPDTFDTTTQEGNKLTVEAEARLLGLAVAATFTPAKRSEVSVTPGEGDRVLITAKKCDLDSSLTVSAQGLTKQLSIKTLCDGDHIRGEISQ